MAYFHLFPGNMKTQLVGPLSFRGMNMKAEELEYMLGKVSITDFGITFIVNVTEYITVFKHLLIKKLSFSNRLVLLRRPSKVIQRLK